MVKDLLRLSEVAHFDLFDDGLQGEATQTDSSLRNSVVISDPLSYFLQCKGLP